MTTTCCNYDAYSRSEYKKNVITPSRDSGYFVKFIEPMISHLAEKFGTPVRVIDVACGFGNSMKFFKKDGRAMITGVDLSAEMIKAVRRSYPAYEFAVVDVTRNRARRGAFDGAVATNATPYCPDKMGSYIFRSLRQEGQAVVNFYSMGKDRNEYYLDIDKIFQDITKRNLLLEIKRKKFELVEIDWTGARDSTRNAGKQVFFKSASDVEGFLSVLGFEIVSGESYAVTHGKEEGWLVTDVYTLQKPARLF